MNPRDLKTTRNTTVHKHPVLAFQLPPREHQYVGPLDLQVHGLAPLQDADAWTVRDQLEVTDGHIDVYVDRHQKHWLCHLGGDLPVLIPCPFERVRYEVGDAVFRECLYDPGVNRSGRMKIRCGKISRADPQAQNLECFRNPLFHELVRAEWEGDDGNEMLISTTGFALYRGEPRRYPLE